MSTESTFGVPILTYHAIEAAADPLATDPSWFAETLHYLTEAGWTCLDLDAWLSDPAAAVPPSRAFALTFDDGLKSIAAALPALRRFDCTATAFLVADRMGADTRWPSQPDWVPRRTILDWSEAAELARNGVRIGSHTRTHPNLKRCRPAHLDDELRGSREVIEDRLGVGCRLLAYPYGVNDPQVRRAAANVYAAALGTRPGWNRPDRKNAWNLRRIDACDLSDHAALKRFTTGRLPRFLRLRARVGQVRRWVRFDAPEPTPAPHRLPSPRRNSGGEWSCPACRSSLTASGPGWACADCARWYGQVAGIPDFRLSFDRYLGPDAERVKAMRLARLEPETDLAGLASAYYTMTPDVDPRRRTRFLAHIAGAEARGHSLLEQVSVDGPILEVGCGTGGFLTAAARAGRTVIGVDIAARWMVVARRRLTDAGCRVPLIAASADALPWRDGTFSTVVADSLIEHLDDPSAALREWARVLKPGGTLIVRSPNRGWIGVEPHVGLLGLGHLPRPLARTYAAWRRHGAWLPSTLHAREFLRLADSEEWSDVRVEAVTPSWAWQGRSSRLGERVAALYRRLAQSRRFGPAAVRWGPIWDVSAIRR